MITKLTTECPYCGKPVVSLWVPGNGMITCSKIQLIADWIYHAACWDKLVDEYPPESFE